MCPAAGIAFTIAARIGKKKYIDPQTAQENLRTLRKLGCSSVHIGGGEPLLKPDELGDVLEISSKVGVNIEYVETNSSWYKDPDSARTILLKLRKRGLQTLLVSISPFHNEYIPFSRIQGVIEAARLDRNRDLPLDFRFYCGSIRAGCGRHPLR